MAFHMPPLGVAAVIPFDAGNSGFIFEHAEPTADAPRFAMRTLSAAAPPEVRDPTNYESRTDWQKALWKSEIDPDSKRYIKQLENLITDNWENTFEGLWGDVEAAINRGLPITDDVLTAYIAESARKQLRDLDKPAWDAAFNGLYMGAKEQAFKPTGFGSGKRKAQIVDTLEEQAVLSHMRQTALEKVRAITNQELRRSILEKLTEPGAYGKNPVQLANQIIREERKRLEEQTGDRAQLRERIKELYDDQLWRIQRVTRTEAANAYWLSQLTGYREQGIASIKFNSHTYEQKTCAICLALDGTIHEIDTLLNRGGRYPLSTLTHPQCRCWPTPIISHTTFEEIEQLYEDEPDLFVPGETIFDRAKLAMEDVVKEQQTIYGTRVEQMPVEHEKEIRDALSAIRESPYQQLQPDVLRFVDDVGQVPEFQKQVPLPEPVLGQVTSWTSPDNELLMSQWAADNGQAVSGAVIREWASRIYEDQDDVQHIMREMYDRDPDDLSPGDLSPKTIAVLMETFKPFTMMRRQVVDGEPAVALEKKLREARDPVARDALVRAGIRDADIETIIKWRADRPSWALDGQYLPLGEPTGSEHNKFVNRAAEIDPRSMFVESAVAYVSDPWTLHRRDPDLYEWLKSKVFGEKEFRD